MNCIRMPFIYRLIFYRYLMIINDKEKQSTEIFERNIHTFFMYIKKSQTLDGQWYESYSFLFRSNDKNQSIYMKSEVIIHVHIIKKLNQGLTTISSNRILRLFFNTNIPLLLWLKMLRITIPSFLSIFYLDFHSGFTIEYIQ